MFNLKQELSIWYYALLVKYVTYNKNKQQDDNIHQKIDK